MARILAFVFASLALKLSQGQELATTRERIAPGADGGAHEAGWGRLGGQGIVALERAATQKYAPAIARGKTIDTSSGEPDFTALLTIALIACIAAGVLLFTRQGREVAGSVPALRPALAMTARLAGAKRSDGKSDGLAEMTQDAPLVKEAMAALNGGSKAAQLSNPCADDDDDDDDDLPPAQPVAADPALLAAAMADASEDAPQL